MSTLTLGSLIPWLAVLSVETIQLCDSAIELHGSSTPPTAACPLCTQPSTALHSRYVRRLADRPWAGIPVVIQLEVRKLFCRNPACPRRIFTQRLPQLTAPCRRQTQRLWEQPRQVALAYGGEAGARTAAPHGVSVSGQDALAPRLSRPAGSYTALLRGRRLGAAQGPALRHDPRRPGATPAC